MTPKEKEQFNRMLCALKRIAKDYQSSDQLRRNAYRDFGCNFEDAIEMAYENLQQEAKIALKGIRSK